MNQKKIASSRKISVRDIYILDPVLVAAEIIPILAKHNVRISHLDCVFETVQAMVSQQSVSDPATEKMPCEESKPQSQK